MILVDIYVPSVDRTYDFMLDENAELSSVMIEVSEMLARKTGSGRPGADNDFVLYHSDREAPLSINKSLYESGVGDGDRLILV